MTQFSCHAQSHGLYSSIKPNKNIDLYCWTIISHFSHKVWRQNLAKFVVRVYSYHNIVVLHFSRQILRFSNSSTRITTELAKTADWLLLLNSIFQPCHCFYCILQSMIPYLFAPHCQCLVISNTCTKLANIRDGTYHLQPLKTKDRQRSTIWQLCSHWWHRMSSLRQLTVLPVPTKLSNWWPFVFSDQNRI